METSEEETRALASGLREPCGCDAGWLPEEIVGAEEWSSRAAQGDAAGSVRALRNRHAKRRDATLGGLCPGNPEVRTELSGGNDAFGRVLDCASKFRARSFPAPSGGDLPEIAGVGAHFLRQRLTHGGVRDVGLEVHARKIALRYLECNSETLIASNSEVLEARSMDKPAHQIRRENFASEVERIGRKTSSDPKDWPKAFADATEENIDYVRQVLKGKDAGGRNIGDKAARRIEAEVLGRPLNWLDQDHAKKNTAPGSDGRSQGLFNNQVENDIDAVRHAVSALYAFIAAERPAEASRMAAAMRDPKDGIPTKFLEHGFVKLLLRALDKGARKAKIAPPSPSA